ncbi:MAG: hypothetical protein M3Y42_15730 [Actinomycetota bacterium]|nr:hypothetical protein [Actinomycetota bacterium]MDQ2958399.1 hypothetical protein [Actinomycetota bacterium]
MTAPAHFDYTDPGFLVSVAGAVATTAGVLVTVLIAVLLRRASKRSEADSATLARQLNAIVLRQRRDELASLVRDVQDTDHLGVLIAEAYRDYRADDLLLILKSYYRNPAVRLPFSNLPPVPVIDTVLDQLAERYRRRSLADALRDLQPFAAATRKVSDNRYKIISFVADRVRDGDTVDDQTIREFLSKGNLDLASAAFYRLDQVNPDRLAHPQVANLLFGACAAVRDGFRLGGDSSGMVTGALPAASGPLTALAQLLHREGLAEIGQWKDDDTLTVSYDHVAAMVVRVCGLLSGSDSWCAMRALQSIPRMLDSIPSNKMRGTRSEELLAEGVADFRRHYLDEDGGITATLLGELDRAVARHTRDPATIDGGES